MGDEPDLAALRARLDAGDSFRLHEVAKLAGVGRTTLNDWIRQKRINLPYTQTPAGQRRFVASGVRALLASLAEVHGEESGGEEPGVPAG